MHPRGRVSFFHRPAAPCWRRPAPPRRARVRTAPGRKSSPSPEWIAGISGTRQHLRGQPGAGGEWRRGESRAEGRKGRTVGAAGKNRVWRAADEGGWKGWVMTNFPMPRATKSDPISGSGNFSLCSMSYVSSRRDRTLLHRGWTPAGDRAGQGRTGGRGPWLPTGPRTVALSDFQTAHPALPASPHGRNPHATPTCARNKGVSTIDPSRRAYLPCKKMGGTLLLMTRIQIRPCCIHSHVDVALGTVSAALPRFATWAGRDHARRPTDGRPERLIYY